MSLPSGAFLFVDWIDVSSDSVLKPIEIYDTVLEPQPEGLYSQSELRPMTSDIREESRYSLMERGQDSNIGRYR